MKRGYTKSWRKELESDIWKMPPLYHRLWFYIRQKANWEVKLMPTNILPKIGMWVSPGMLITSLSQLADNISYFSQGGLVVPDRKTIHRILQWLEQSGMIMLDCHTRGTIIYVLNWEVYQSNNDLLSHQTDIGMDIEKDIGMDTTKELKRIKKKVKALKEVKEKDKDKYSVWMFEIISDLNEVLGTEYKTDPVSKDIQELIVARINDGFVLDDFKKVHRIKNATWRHDSKFSKFLRPQTLYTAKFSAYLNEKVSLSDRGTISPMLDKHINVFKEFEEEQRMENAEREKV
jgi:uncharacterized phage protein (TIGR02220 family)